MAANNLAIKLAGAAGTCLLLGALAIAGASAFGPASTAGAQPGEPTVIYGADDDFDALAYKVPGEGSEYVEGVAREFEQERAQEYPYQYWTFATEKYRDGKPFGHSTNQGKVEGPWERYYGGGQPVYDEEGHMLIAGYTWDKATNTWIIEYPKDFASYGFSARCYACKSVKFNDLYAENGSAAFGMVMDDEVMAFIGGEIWSCGSCHEDPENPTSEVDSQHLFFNTIIGDDGADLTPGERICGQCHNQTFFTGMCKDEEYFRSEKPFRYGFDADALIQAQIEDDMTYPDENGISRVGGMHGDLELFLGSVHDSLGMDCTTCHMPTLIAPDGSTFTDHDASQSPLENAASLDTCLSCHKAQGIEDAESMVAMVRGLQAEIGQREADLRIKLDELEAAIVGAIELGTYSDQTLDTLRSNLFVADFYNEYCIGSYAAPGVKIAHNPVAVDSYLSRAEKLVADSFALIEAGK